MDGQDGRDFWIPAFAGMTGTKPPKLQRYRVVQRLFMHFSVLDRALPNKAKPEANVRWAWAVWREVGWVRSPAVEALVARAVAAVGASVGVQGQALAWDPNH